MDKQNSEDVNINNTKNNRKDSIYDYVKNFT